MWIWKTNGKSYLKKQMTERKCKTNNCKDDNGNCPIPGSDSLPVQCVGPWSADKYYFLERYLNATCEARRKFSDRGNAVFIDLFSGPGLCIIKNQQKEIAGGGLRAALREKAAFNELYYFDIINDNVTALNKRLSSIPNCSVQCGDANILVKALVSKLIMKPYRYHFAFIDPFGPDGLCFETIKELAKLKRMDLLIHFPIGAIKRNIPNWIKNKNTILDRFMGTDTWRDKLIGKSDSAIYTTLIDTYMEQLKAIGYPEDGLRLASSSSSIFSGLPVVSVKNTKEVDLYVLILAAKNKLAQKIWTSVIKRSPDGQKSLF